MWSTNVHVWNIHDKKPCPCICSELIYIYILNINGKVICLFRYMQYPYMCVYEISIEQNPACARVWIRIYNEYKFKGNMLVYVYGVSIYICGTYIVAKLARIYV